MFLLSMRTTNESFSRCPSRTAKAMKTETYATLFELLPKENILFEKHTKINIKNKSAPVARMPD